MYYSKEEIRMSEGKMCSFLLSILGPASYGVLEKHTQNKEGKITNIVTDPLGFSTLTIDCEGLSLKVPFFEVIKIPAIDEMRKTKLYQLKESGTSPSKTFVIKRVDTSNGTITISTNS